MNRPHYALVAVVMLTSTVPGTLSTAAEAQQTHTLRIATLAPRGSSWMRIFNAWDASLGKETGGRLKLRFYPGGVAGDERDFVRKMRVGQMDGAAVTQTGLGLIVPPVLVLAAPGLFTDYSRLYRARDLLSDQLDEEFRDEGYELLGWGDAGMLNVYSNAQPIRRPSDFKQVRPWAWRDDVLFTEVLRAVGANPVRLGVPEVYPALQTGMIDTLPSSALAAVSLQWFTRLKFVTSNDLSILIGATIVRKDKYDALPVDLRAALDEVSEKAHRMLRSVIRRDDAEAYESMLQRGMEEVDVGRHEGEWLALAKKVRRDLAGRLYPASLLAKVERIAAD